MDVTQTNKPWLPGPRKAPPAPAVGHLWLPSPKALLTELCLQGAGLTGATWQVGTKAGEATIWRPGLWVPQPLVLHSLPQGLLAVSGFMMSLDL